MHRRRSFSWFHRFYRPWLLPACTLAVVSALSLVDSSTAIAPLMLGNYQIGGLAARANDVEEGDKLMDAAQQQYQPGQLREALATYQRALETYRRGQGDEVEQLLRQDGVAASTQMIGLIYGRMGQYQQALQSLEQAIQLHEAVMERASKSDKKDPALRIFFRNRNQVRSALSFLSLVYYRLGQYPKALELSRDAIARSGRSMGDYALDGEIFNQLGSIYASQGDYTKALEAYYRALILVEEAGYPFGRDISKGGKPVNFIEANKIIYGFEQPSGKALTDFLERSLQIGYHQPTGMLPWARYTFTATMNNLGDLYLKMGRPQARQFYFKALESSKFARSAEQEAISLNNVGRSYGRSNDAVPFYQQALTISRQLSDRALEGKTLTQMGELSLQTGDYRAAADQLNAAIAAWESLRPGLSDANLVSLFETQTQTYESLQKALVAQKNYGQALEVAERGRARAFVEMLARRIKPVDAEQTSVPALSLGQIQQIAKTQRATLVEYSIISNQLLYIWVVKPSGELAFEQVDLTAFLAKHRVPLASYVDMTRFNALGVRGRNLSFNTRRVRGTPGNVSPELNELYQLLIAPIAAHLPSEPGAKVVFVPQGPLFLVPFAALQNPKGQYLIEQYTISMTPSIQVLELAQRQSGRGGEGSPTGMPMSALIVGNPTMPKIILEAGMPPEQLSPLPGAEAEARAIADLLKTTPVIGDAAKESAITKQMPSQRLIHLATHGMLDDFKGLGVPGALALAPESAASVIAPGLADPGDGLLTSNEILDLKLNADLVVLSACDTGRGTITGDGVIGLSRSLILAGTPSVVVSLWAVPDAPTASLMTAFYQALLTNPNRSTALRQAMLTTLKQYPDPRDWAAFVVVGEGR
jgi:CHAT domain-containing protein/tetratricopeptide (TPR) repeat protein